MQMPVNDYKSALAFMLGRVNYETFRQMPYGEMRQNLGRLKAFLENLGRPDRRYPIVHVAGTKGKGSTCAMLAAILNKAGYRVGCFTSPHLHKLNERFAVNGVPCPDDRLVEIVQHLELQETAAGNAVSEANGVTGERSGASVRTLRCAAFPAAVSATDDQTHRELTFFELSVLFAFEYFAREQVDIAVIETGLGGRFDATNICDPILSVITSISFDHTEQLGNTLSAIAREKAGIIKSGVPVVSGVTSQEDDDPQAVIRETVRRIGVHLYEIDRDFSIVPNEEGLFDFRWHRNMTQSLKRLQLVVPGRHQRDNAALALACVILLRERSWLVTVRDVRTALANLKIPCRVERLKLRRKSAPTVFVDGAHNKASAEALLEALQTFRDMPDGRKTLLFGSTIGKDVSGMFETLLPFFDELWLSQCTTSPRALSVDELLIQAQNVSYRPEIVSGISSPAVAVEHIMRITNKNDLVCVTGSLYFAAETRYLLLHRHQ